MIAYERIKAAIAVVVSEIPDNSEWIRQLLIHSQPPMTIAPNILRYNESDIMAADQEELIWLIRHEVEHIIRRHYERSIEIYQGLHLPFHREATPSVIMGYEDTIGQVDSGIAWAQACDLEVNDGLRGYHKEFTATGITILPGREPFEFLEAGGTAEWYYFQLIKRKAEGATDPLRLGTEEQRT